jgi:hypothetical protein
MVNVVSSKVIPAAIGSARSCREMNTMKNASDDHAVDASFPISSNEGSILAESACTKLSQCESAKSHLFDTSTWGPFCDVTLTLKQGRQTDRGHWMRINDYGCGQAFRHFMNLLNRTVYGAAFRRHGKRLRVLPVLEKGEVRARALRSCERGRSGRWHIHCAIELPPHFDAIALERLIHRCWAKVEWGCSRILVRDCANAGWIHYMLKDRQKSEFDGFLDCILMESLHNPIVDA